MSIEATIHYLNRSRWWYFASVLVPALIAGAGGVYLVHEIAWRQNEIKRQRVEIDLLGSQLWETQQSLNRCMGPSP